MDIPFNARPADKRKMEKDSNLLRAEEYICQKKDPFSADGFSALTRHGKNRYTEEKENGECPPSSPLFPIGGQLTVSPKRKEKPWKAINIEWGGGEGEEQGFADGFSLSLSFGGESVWVGLVEPVTSPPPCFSAVRSPRREFPRKLYRSFLFSLLFLRELDGGRRELISSGKKRGTPFLRTIKAGTSFSNYFTYFLLSARFFFKKNCSKNRKDCEKTIIYCRLGNTLALRCATV